jgi:hypothetical protein
MKLTKNILGCSSRETFCSEEYQHGSHVNVNDMGTISVIHCTVGLVTVYGVIEKYATFF